MVDVLVLNYNDATTVEEYIGHIKGYRNIRKILVVDNCSTDDSMDRLLRYQDEKVEVISSGRNGGYGYGNNKGIRYLADKYGSELILLSNPDVIVSENTIDAMESFLRKHEDYAIVAPLMVDEKNVVQYNTALKIVSKMQYILALEVLYSKMFKPFYYKNIEQENGEFKTVEGVSGSMFMLRVEEMLLHGMFDEKIFLYGEEIVLSLLLRRAGLKAGLLLKEKFIHKHSVSISKTYKSLIATRKLLLKSHTYILREYYGVKGIEYGIVRLFGWISLCEIGVISFLKR